MCNNENKPGWNAFTPLINDATIYHTQNFKKKKSRKSFFNSYADVYQFTSFWHAEFWVFALSFSFLLPSSLFALNLMTHSSRMKNYFCTFFYLSHCVTFVMRRLKDSSLSSGFVCIQKKNCSYSLKSMNNDLKWDGINLFFFLYLDGAKENAKDWQLD